MAQPAGSDAAQIEGFVDQFVTDPGNGGAGLPCWMNFPWLHPLEPPG